MQINPYLMFNGCCAEAFRFYEQLLGGRITMMQTHGESPMADQVAPAMKDMIIHARMELGDQVLMGSDAPPDHYRAPQGFHVSVQFDDPAEAERIYAGLAENATIVMALQKTFWAERFAMLTDRFGTPWLVNCEGKKA